MPRIDLNALSVFAALFTELHVTRAAARLGVTQSAVSHALRGLRERFDDPLFERGAKGLRPTKRASQLAPRILEAVEAAQDVYRQGPNRFPQLPRALQVSMSDYGVAVFLLPFAQWLASDHPEVNLRVGNRSRADSLADLESRKLDLAVGVFPGLDHERLRQSLLLQDPFVTVAWKGNPRIARGLSFDTYVDLPHVLVTVSGDARGTVDEHLERRGRRRRVALTVPSFVLAPELIVGTDRLLTISSTTLALRPDLAPQLVAFRPPLDLPVVDVVAVTHARSDADAILQACCRTLRQIGRRALAEGRSIGRALKTRPAPAPKRPRS